jgi:DNA-binding NarL/FixJ family response regulator
MDNVLDMIGKGRRRGGTSIGESNGSSKLTTSEVIEIRKLYEQGFTTRAIAERFSTSMDNVRAIVRRKTWKHVDYEDDIEDRLIWSRGGW